MGEVKTPAGEQGDLRTVSRAADVLRAFMVQQEWGVSALARHLGISKSMVHRIVTTLVNHDILRVDPDTSLYSVGDLVRNLARSGATRPSLVRMARPLLEEACALTAETVSLCELNEGHGLCLDFVESPHSMRMTVYRGQTFALSAGGIGKALLAFQSEAFIEDYLNAGPLQRYTENTITDAATLRAEMARVRNRGVAYSEAEITPGASSVGVPVIEADGHVRLSLCISAPTSRFPAEKREEASRLLRTLAARLSASLEVSLTR